VTGKRSKFIVNEKAADWLQEQEQTIVPPWIGVVQRKTASLGSGPRTRQMESAQLIEFFDSLVNAARTGSIGNLDSAIQALVEKRLGRGYRLVEFLDIANQLKIAIWNSVQSSMTATEALEVLACLEPIFAHSTTRLAWLASRTAETQLEEELERTRWALTKLDRIKSDFISIAAHELKTPLTLVQGYTSMLANELAEHPRFRDALYGLNNGIKRLQDIIKDLIDVSLIDSNVLTVSLQPAALAEIVRLAADDLEHDTLDRELQIEIERFPKAVELMHLDPQRIYQVFINLIGNAIKYTPDGGKVTVEAQVLQGQTADLDFVKVAVADTGIGIAPDDLPHIFEKFYRVGETELHSTGKTKFKGGGPGLGLAIVKGIVEAHGGRIWAESPGYDEKLCPGTTFNVMLPIYREPPDRPSERLLGLDTDRLREEW
jgi:signal transduction histidine kinase